MKAEKKPVYTFTAVITDKSGTKKIPLNEVTVNKFIGSEKNKFEIRDAKNAVIMRKTFRG